MKLVKSTPRKLNRAQRRKLQKMDKDAIEQLKREITADAVRKIGRSEDEFAQAENDRTSMFYACSILALHYAFNFDQEECIRYAEEIDRLMGEIMDDKRTYESTIQELDDTLDIKIVP